MGKQEEKEKEQRKAWLREQLTARPEPDRGRLEKTLEANETCPQCKGKVRAICDSYEPTKEPDASMDAEIRVTLYCRNAVCGWQVTQIRPWRAGKPDEI
jgi:hypothetical protein